MALFHALGMEHKFPALFRLTQQQCEAGALWQRRWPLSSWLGTALCSFYLQEFAPGVDPKHSVKAKVTSSVPQTAVRLCFVPPSFTTASYLCPLWDMGISANFEPF